MLKRGISETIVACRSCGSSSLEVFLDLGVSALADRLVNPDDLGAEEIKAPLRVAFCKTCGLVQIDETVEPEILFYSEYPYYSSVSPALVEHSRKNVEQLIRRRGLTGDSLVMEIASNDGYLLQHYTASGVPVLGIDPAPGPAAAAEKVGVPTMNAFFTDTLAEELRREGRMADVVHANNVLAHVADTNGFVAGIRTILKDQGVAVIEAPYVRELIDHVEFDTIYHQHLCYFSVTALDKLFRRHQLFLNDLDLLDIHGGSLRLYVEPVENVGRRVSEQLALEAEIGLDRLEYYTQFSSRVATLRSNLTSTLAELKRDGARIAGYGAAAKAATLINYAEIGPDMLDF
ncbi:MAG: class I SAM-dependent methyltransferase, partial [Pseudomonadota bacterium]